MYSRTNSTGSPNRRIIFVTAAALIVFTIICLNSASITIHKSIQNIHDTVTNYSITTLSSFHSDTVENGHTPQPLTNQTAIIPFPTKQKTFDLVVSMYREDFEEMNEQLRAIKSVPSIAALKPRIIVYTKDADANVDEIREALGAHEVTILKNKGREGGTYLHHIVSSWDSLASYTFFMQATMHDVDSAVQRIKDYFVPSTGMLPLGYILALCDCENCIDGWDGSRIFHRIPQLYSAATGQLCPSPGITMGYQGQMIASRGKIKDTPKHVYEHVKEVLEAGPEHWIHADKKQDMFKDEPGEPYFGHVLERSWNLLFNCSRASLAESCPHIHLGREEGDADDKCQCLDEGL